MTYPWGTERRFNAYVNYLRQRFGARMQKISLDAGFTCPNRDGTVGRGGCTYCNNDAFNPSICDSSKPIEEQIREGLEFQTVRYKNVDGFLAYFQTYSNTYASLPVLKDLYERALDFDEVKGLIIGTRPDCVDNEKLDYLAELARKYYVVVEYGIESCYDRTLKRINRGHDFETTKRVIWQTAGKSLNVGAHLILGLPGESREEILEEAKILSGLPLTNLKLHQLQIMKKTVMAREYEKTPEDFHLLELDEYIELVVDFLERLSPDIKIERLAGEAPPWFVVAGQWNIRYDQMLTLIEKNLRERNTWQGKYYTNPDA